MAFGVGEASSPIPGRLRTRPVAAPGSVDGQGDEEMGLPVRRTKETTLWASARKASRASLMERGDVKRRRSRVLNLGEAGPFESALAARKIRPVESAQYSGTVDTPLVDGIN